MFLVLVMSLTVVSSSQLGASAEEYLLGPEDRVRIKVYEWRASRDVLFEWDALNDQFTVGPHGAISLPFAGEVQAAGFTSAALAKSVAEELRRNMGLGRLPDVAIEVTEFRPYYIVGSVMRPGAFPYRPGLTVLQALSVAGGLNRQEGLARLEREIIQGRGELSLLGLDKVNLLVRNARLKAEFENSEAIQLPDELRRMAKDQVVAVALQQEQQIFNARRDAIAAQMQALESLTSFLDREFTSLQAQLTLLDKQVELIERELESVSGLVSRGLATASRELSLERALAQLQSERLSAQTSLLRTQQEISKTEIAMLELRNRHLNEVAEKLREAQVSLDALERRRSTTDHLLHESMFIAPAALAQGNEVEPRYTIVRPDSAGTTVLDANESSWIRPGDTLKVEIPIQNISGLSTLADF